ncbi:uncharacterized protein LOC110444888 [Mizuhopecten yessoensis]|uniref:uncharacterized protein LOC110444888 n=1 Tax=Mizuhopecten yessoensis TaxID=6573 RepID=UPI000B457B9C|nr:uncharacterized protein LOC110444888 [Mizuhopecten yessoensis]
MSYWAVLLSLLALLTTVRGHGFLKRPAQRSTVWREGLNPALVKNYNDMGVNCGGAGRQYSETNDGRCGTCGDAFDGTRDHELGGKYGSGYISPNAVYTQGQVIPAVVDITANHKGWFEFRICPAKNNYTPVTKECLESNVLTLDGGSTRYILHSATKGDIAINVHLPDDLSCDHCVLQWYWKAGNSNKNQETFVNCADVTINALAVQPSPSPTTTSTAAMPNSSTLPTTTLPSTMACYPGQSRVCRWTGPDNPMMNQSQLDAFCASTSSGAFFEMNCRCGCEWSMVPGDCTGIQRTWENIPNADPFCAANCGQCPTSHCRC